MNFWQKIAEKFLPNYSQAELERRSLEGSRLERILAEGHFDVLKDLILDPMERESFDVLKKVNPKEITDVIQAQKLAQVIDLIKKRIESKVIEGRHATKQLLSISTSKETSENG